jgi:hypothetical protein
MSTMDPFASSAFSLNSLTAAINNPPEGQIVPTVVDTLFSEEGVTTTALMIERQGEALAMITAAERGAPATVVTSDKRDMIPFATLHLPSRGTIKADEVQGVRAFGSESQEQLVQTVIDQRIAKMRRQLDATIRYHRIGAIKGSILDANGSTVLLNLFTAFGISQQTEAMALATATTKVRTKVLSAKRKAEDVIGDSGMITGWMALCGRGFFDAFIDHDDVRDAYAFYQANLKSGDPRSGFPFVEVMWREYYGKVGGVDFIGTDDAYLIPLGIPDLFITRFAPADYMETVNTMGLPYYAKSEPMAFNKGVYLEGQSNPLNLCTKPRAVIKLTRV